jgi:hypothetical protein
MLLFKKSILRSQAVCNRFGVLGEGGNCYYDEEKQAFLKAHRRHSG